MTAPSSLPPGLDGAPTWMGGPVHPSASLRSQVAGAVVVVSAGLVLVGPHPAVLPWGLVWLGAFVAGVVAAVAAPPIALFDRASGVVVALGVGVATAFLYGVAASSGLVLPPGLLLVLPMLAVGLDWQRTDRIRPVVLCAIAVAVLGAIEGSPMAIGGAVAVVAMAMGTLALLEADRRAGLPQVQVDGTVGRARTDDLLTTLLVVAAVALVAALVLSVPSCQRRSSSSGTGGSGAGSGQVGRVGEGGQVGGADGPSDHRYVPDPEGRFLVPPDGSGRSGEPIPIPDAVFDGPGGTRTTTGGDGSTVRVIPRGDGDADVSVRGPDGTVTRYRYHRNPDGTTRIERLAPDGSVSRTWTYDPEGRFAEEGTRSPSSDRPTQDQPKNPPKDRRLPDLAGALKVLGAVLVLAALAVLAAWLWRGRQPAPEVDPGAPPWALALAARLASEGAARGRPRGRGEPIVAYGRALGAEALPDERIVGVAEVVSAALFSGRPVPDADRVWAETSLDQVVEAHPRPSRRERAKADAG